MGEPGGKLEEQPGGVARDWKSQSRHGGVGLKEREIQEFRSVMMSESIRRSGHRRGIGEKRRRRGKFNLFLDFGIVETARGRESSTGAQKRGEGLEHILCASTTLGPFIATVSCNLHHNPVNDPYFLLTDKALRGGPEKGRSDLLKVTQLEFEPRLF